MSDFPRRWTIWDSGFELIASGPELGLDEDQVEVIEALPGVIIDDLGPDLRGEDAPSFSAYRPAFSAYRPAFTIDPSPREAMHNVFTPNYGDARGEEVPRFGSDPQGVDDGLGQFTTTITYVGKRRRREIRLGRYRITIERMNLRA